MSPGKKLPPYVWTLLSLVTGIVAGSLLPGFLVPLAAGATLIIALFVQLAPLLILVALSPAISTLVRRGLAGRFALSVVLWYVATSTVAGLFGATVAALIFRIPLSTDSGGVVGDAMRMLGALSNQGVSLPLLAVLGAAVVGMLGAWSDKLYSVLSAIERGIARAGGGIGYAMIPLVLLFGINIGVRFGAQLGMAHYATMTLLTAALCGAWSAFYLLLVVRPLTGRDPRQILVRYYLPTAVVAVGTTSSLATLPVNLANVKRLGVRNEVADFVVPFGAVGNLDGSALMYIAYAPFVLTRVFDIGISWTTLLAAWPAIILFTIAAPGLPAGIGTALWSATLFASMLGLEEPLRSDFVLTWVALAGGLPDMIRTTVNVTGDGFAAIVFDRFFERFLDPQA